MKRLILKPGGKTDFYRAKNRQYPRQAGAFSRNLAKALEGLVSQNPYARENACSRLAAYSSRNVTPAIIKRLETENSAVIRGRYISAFKKIRDKSAILLLKNLVFDLQMEVRGPAAEALAYQAGWKKTLKFIMAKFNSPGKVPMAFFYDSLPVGRNKGRAEWRREDWNMATKQAVIDAKKYGLTRMKNRRGNPYSVNGIPVFLGSIFEGDGFYTNGMLIVSRAIKRQGHREATAQHEFGEIFSHETGNAFEFDYLRKTGQLKNYLRDEPNKLFQFREIERNWTK